MPKELEAMGGRVALHPTLAASVGMQAAWHVLHDFKSCGDWQAQMRSGPHGMPNFGELTGMAKMRELEAKFILAEQQRDYETSLGAPLRIVKDRHTRRWPKTAAHSASSRETTAFTSASVLPSLMKPSPSAALASSDG